MVATIIRRMSRTQILRNLKRDQIEIYKTGVHTNPIVNEAIDRVDAESRDSGSGASSSSAVIPKLLKKRRDLEKQGKGNGKD